MTSSDKVLSEYNDKYKSSYLITEHFECDCGSIDDVIIARVWKETDSNDRPFYDLNLTFKTSCNDSQQIWYYVNPNNSRWENIKTSVKIFFRRLSWRLKTSLEILFKGKIEYEGTWIPARIYIDEKNYSLFGYETVMKFSEWLKIHAEFIKDEYNKQK